MLNRYLLRRFTIFTLIVAKEMKSLFVHIYNQLDTIWTSRITSKLNRIIKKSTISNVTKLDLVTNQTLIKNFFLSPSNTLGSRWCVCLARCTRGKVKVQIFLLDLLKIFNTCQIHNKNMIKFRPTIIDSENFRKQCN